VEEGVHLVKGIIRLLIPFLAGLAIGAGGIYFGLPHMVHARVLAAEKAKFDPAPFDAKTAVLVTEPKIESNLADQGHYISFALSFQVSPTAFTAAGGSASAAGASGSGTGSALLDAEIQNDVINVLRSTSYASLSTSGGLAALKSEISTVLQSIFGPGAIGAIYFSNLVTQ
jgi:flagellar basal body-associated protein FliL